MTNNPVRLGLVGLGSWGRTLIESVQRRSSKVAFTAAVVRARGKHRDYARVHDLELRDRLEDLLTDPTIDGIVLATPHSLHAGQAEACAAAAKPVLVEKPFALTRAEAQRAIDAARRAGVVLGAAHNRRFLPAVQKLKELVGTGALGTILHVEGNMSSNSSARYTPGSWRLSGTESPAGGLAGAGIHIIDLMIHVLGFIRSVYATAHRGAVAIDMDDTTAALLRFATGASGYLGTITATAPIFRVQVFATAAAAEIRGEKRLEIRWLDGRRTCHEFPAFDTERAELEAFAAAIRGEAEYPVPLDEVLAGVAAFEAIPISARRGHSVDLP